MPDPVPDTSLWLVDDASAAAAIGDRASVRLDLPGWQVALEALPSDGAVGVAVGRAEDPLALGAALAAVAGAQRVELLLTDVRAAAEAVGAALSWGGVEADAVRMIELSTGPALHATLGGQGRATVAVLGALAAPRPPAARAGVGWRVGMVGPAARAWLGSWVRTLPVPRAALGALEDRYEHLDVVVVSPADGWAEPDLAALLQEAHGLGAATVAIAVEDAAWAAAASVHLSPTADVRPVDVQRVNPQGWRRSTGDAVGLVPGERPRDLSAALATAREHLEPQRLRLVGVTAADDHLDVPTLPTAAPGVLQVLRDLRGAVDHPALHADAAAQASWLATCALAAVPVVCLELPDETARLLGDRLAGALRGTRLADLDDPDERERRTVLARRAAWLEHSTRARWRLVAPDLGLPVPHRIRFSMLLATNRPDFLEHVVTQIARQTWEEAEVVVALHGQRFAPDAAQRIIDQTGRPTTVLRVPEREPLGGVLNAAAEAAGGDVLTKFDDDDWYSPDHLVDLAMALEYSGAQLVGKAAEFVHLAGSDVTIRRFVSGAETASRSLAGGTLTFRRDVLRDVGGFLRVGLREDGALIDDVLAAGGQIHRTHGFGYVLHRHGRHAWAADDAYFLDQAAARRPGLDHEWTLT